MKKILGLIVLGVSFPVWGAELVSAVNFNPSRLGDYEQLVVSKEATLPGGLTTPELVVKSNGEVKLIDVSSQTSTKIMIRNGEGIKGEAGNVTLDFPSAFFSTKTPSEDDVAYIIDNEFNYFTTRAVKSFVVRGNGQVSFTGGNGHSAIKQVAYDGSGANLGDMFFLYAQTLKTPTLAVTGNDSRKMLESNGTLSSKVYKGLNLRGTFYTPVIVPFIVNKVFENINDTTPNNTKTIATSADGCQLAWVSRVLDNNTSKLLLALSNCGNVTEGTMPGTGLVIGKD